MQANYRYNYGNGNFAICTLLYDLGLSPQYLGRFWVGWGYGFATFTTDRTHTMTPKFTVVAFPMPFDRKHGRYSYLINSRCEIRREDISTGNYASESSPILETCFPYMAANNEPNVIARIRLIASAQETYRSTLGAGNYAGTLALLSDAGLIEPVLEETIELYRISMSAVPTSATLSPTFKISVRPLFYRESGLRSFYLDQTGVLRGADHAGGDPSENDPPV